MKDSFKAITFNRKQRVAFFVILLLIGVGSVINIGGFVSERQKMQDVVSLDEVITQQYYYKKYYKSKYKKSYTGRKNGSYSKGNSKNFTNSNSSANSANWKTSKSYYQSDSSVSNSVAHSALDTLSTVSVPSDYTLEARDTATIPSEKSSQAFALSEFDPNVATKDDLMLMYLPEKWVDNVINYRTKGGVYRTKEDVKKLYTTTSELYSQIESYLTISEIGITLLEEKQTQDKDAENAAWLEEVIKTSDGFDINTINEETLVKLPLVTASLARKILKYKGILGGYHQSEQLLEVYDMEQSIYDAILPYLSVDPIVELIDINTDDLNTLSRHPYIGYKKAKVIKRYRGQHGDFQSVDQVKKVGVWNTEKFALLKPYLMVKDAPK